MNRSVTVSSFANNNNTGSSAVDGNAGTEWMSASGNNQWIYVDLDSVMNLTGAKLTWGADYGQLYNIQVSLTSDVDPTLTRQLQMFLRQNGHLVQDVNELANARLNGVAPPPPAGKKLEIDKQTTEVKAVPAP